MTKDKIKKFLDGLNKDVKRGLLASSTGAYTYIFDSHRRRLIESTLNLIFAFEGEVRGLNEKNNKLKSRVQEVLPLIPKLERDKLEKIWKKEDEKEI